MTTEVLESSRTVSTMSMRQLARIEARRSLRRASIWIGAILLFPIMSDTTADWPGGSYSEKLLGFMPIALGTFIAAFRTGRRDGSHDVAESAPLDADDRALARLASLALPLAITLVAIVGLAVASRIEGGFWMGDHPRRTDTALHPFSELLQPLLLVILCGVAGIAIGRTRRALSGGIIFGMLLFTFFPAYWIWNSPPVHVVAPLQIQPMGIDLADGTTIDETPESWYVEDTNDFGEPPRHQLVHQPTIIGHDIYLVGLIALAVGAAVRGIRGRRIALAGAGIALTGVVVQLLVSPV